MSGRSYPIWDKVQACIYQSNKSYGAKQTSSVDVLVGTSSSNSHQLISHTVTHRDRDGRKTFRFYVGYILMRHAVLRKDSSELEDLHVHIPPVEAAIIAATKQKRRGKEMRDLLRAIGDLLQKPYHYPNWARLRDLYLKAKGVES